MAKGHKTGGRQKGTPNKITADIKALAGKHSPAAVKELVRIMGSSESDAARVAAAKELLDRAHGKAHQTNDTTITDKRMVEAPVPAKDVGEWAKDYGPH